MTDTVAIAGSAVSVNLVTCEESAIFNVICIEESKPVERLSKGRDSPYSDVIRKEFQYPGFSADRVFAYKYLPW